MAEQSPSLSTTGSSFADPGLAIRRWVAGFLRVGVGLILLGSGLEAYFALKSGLSRGLNLGTNEWGYLLDPLLLAIPYVAIGLGLALILGFLTTVSAISAAIFSLLTPFSVIISLVIRGTSGNNFGGGGWSVNSPLSMTLGIGLISLIPYAALIWLSPMENHPISVDALIFGKPRVPEIFATNRPEVETNELEPDTKVLPATDHSSG